MVIFTLHGDFLSTGAEHRRAVRTVVDGTQFRKAQGLVSCVSHSLGTCSLPGPVLGAGAAKLRHGSRDCPEASGKVSPGQQDQLWSEGEQGRHCRGTVHSWWWEWHGAREGFSREGQEARPGALLSWRGLGPTGAAQVPWSWALAGAILAGNQ